MQFFGIDKTNPETHKELSFAAVENSPDDVTKILERACYDCHSNNTKWPWYSSVAPVSWVVEDHVEEAREELNFSNWKNYSEDKKHHKLDEMIEEVGEGEMPLKGYVVWHDEALISPQDTAVLFSYVRGIMKKYDSKGLH